MTPEKYMTTRIFDP